MSHHFIKLPIIFLLKVTPVVSFFNNLYIRIDFLSVSR